MANVPHMNKGRAVQGSMPCGNPKRYASRDVIQMTHAGKRARSNLEDDDSRTEAEKHIHTLVKQQTNTDVSLVGQFSQHRAFTSVTSHDPGVDHLTGLLQYKNYREVEELDAHIDELRHCGLTDEEIAIKLKEDMKDQLQFTDSQKSFGANPAFTEQRLAEIDERIRNRKMILKKPDSFKGALELSRQSRDLEKSIAQRYGKESVLPESMIRPKNFEDCHPEDPINKIADIVKDVEGKVERESRRDRRRKRKIDRRKKYYTQFNLSKNIDGESFESERMIGDELKTFDHDSGSEETDEGFIGPLPKETFMKDCSDSSQLVTDTAKTFVLNEQKDVLKGNCSPSASHNTENNSEKFEGQDFKEISDKKIGSCNASSVLSAGRTLKQIAASSSYISEEDIIQNRLSEEEIRNVEKFKNYERGKASKVVYVKNLPNKTREEDLVSLFGRFQSDGSEAQDIWVRLLTGRMKGQAFITFPDETTASKAIDLVNGYKFKGRPIILSFGKNST